MKKTREQNELENREKVQIFFRLIVNSWTISRLRKEVAPKLIKKEFIAHCRKARVPFLEARRMLDYLVSEVQRISA